MLHMGDGRIEQYAFTVLIALITTTSAHRAIKPHFPSEVTILASIYNSITARRYADAEVATFTSLTVTTINGTTATIADCSAFLALGDASGEGASTNTGGAGFGRSAGSASR